MKIAFDHKIFWSQKYGGISRYYTNLFIKFLSKDINFRVFSSYYKNSFLRDLDQKNVEGQYVKHSLPYTSFFYKRLNEILSPIKMHNWKPDIIHYTYYYQKFKKKNKPIIITVYDLIHEKNSLASDKPIFPKKKIIDSADHIICISKETKKDLLKFYNVEEKKTSVIYLAGDHLNTNNINQDYQFDFVSKPYILFVGSRSKYKNFEILIQALASNKIFLNDFDLVLFGGEKISNYERKYFYQNNINEQSIKHIYGNEDLLNSLYKKAQLFIFPSLAEGFGIPIIESWLNHCPVLCSNIPVFKEICGDAVNYFDPKDKTSLVSSLESVLYSTFKRDELKKKGSLKSKEYSWDKCADETIKIYKNFFNE